MIYLGLMFLGNAAQINFSQINNKLFKVRKEKKQHMQEINNVLPE